VTEDHINAYEGLFLFPQAQAGSLQGAVDHLKDILSRAQAEVIGLRKWDERRLAFEIKGNKRGVYFLVYFRAPAPHWPGSSAPAISRSCYCVR
jgi:small subunit ribosomal protein S6